MTIQIEKAHLKLVKEILSHFKERFKKIEIFVFGSRAAGSARPVSDLDLCIRGKAPVDSLLMAELRESFAKSRLPFKVDLVDYCRATREFQKIIDTKKIKLF